ncbi:MAG: Gfo/Idh/MocA family oxidoreductase [Candidatus Poribacteria bacterium]|nr:Gfo/Idh/MocA family oxidoreductase [Candidatus Poribacteria bacterium]
MAKTYRIGIVGCGGMGHSHARAWTDHPAAEIVAATDVSEEAAKKLAAEFSVPAVYTDHNEMFEKEDIDIVSIPTWQGVRAEVTIAAANAGVKGILGEKPMAASLGEANDMIDACEKNGVKLAIGHQGRFNPNSNEIRRLVADGAIGQPTMVYHRAKPNAGLLNTGTHAIDGWRYILSDPETLWVVGQTSRTTDRWERRSRCEDLCMGLVCFEGGTRGVYEGDLPEPKAPMPTIYGTEGQIKVGGSGVILSGSVMLENGQESGWQEITPPPVETNQYQELIDWIEGKIDEHRSSGRQARYTVEIMMSIYESLRIKNVVTMPLQTRECPLDLMIDDGTLPVLKPGRYDLRTPFPEKEQPQ